MTFEPRGRSSKVMTLYPHRRTWTVILGAVAVALVVATTAAGAGSWKIAGPILYLAACVAAWQRRVELELDQGMVTVTWRGLWRRPTIAFDRAAVVGVFAEKRVGADRLVIVTKDGDGSFRDVPLLRTGERGTLHHHQPPNAWLESRADEIRAFLELPTS